MKTLIVYYSRTGGNKKAAAALQKKINSDIEEIKDTVDRSGGMGMFRSAMGVLFGKKTTIAPAEKSPGNYDLTVMVTPIWVGKTPPATAAYLQQHRDQMKAVAVLSVSGSGEKNTSFLPGFEKTAGKKVTAALLLTEKETKEKSIDDLLKPLLRKIL
jgi:flavodoxin